MAHKSSYTVFVKTGPACNAGCISCPSGSRREVEPIPLMKADMFARILDRILEQGNIISVVLHYYNEPTLNPHMPYVIREAKKRKLDTRMSTNGSRPELLMRCYEEGIDNLIFSVSGFTQAIHERSHHGISIDTVKQAMIDVAKLRDEKFPGSYIKAGWHDYLYNRHEAHLMKQFCINNGIYFDSYQTSVLPLYVVTKRFYELRSADNLPELSPERDLLTKLPEAALMCKERKHWECIYQNGMFAVDGNGSVSICPADISNEDNSNTYGNIFNINLKQFTEDRKKCSWCFRCKSVGAHVYGMQKYRTPITPMLELRRKAEDIYRQLGLGHRFPKLSKFLGSLMYERPRGAV